MAAERVIPLDHCELTFEDYWTELKLHVDLTVERYSKIASNYDVILRDTDRMLRRADQELRTRGADHAWFYSYMCAMIIGELLLKSPSSKEAKRADETKKLKQTFGRAYTQSMELKEKVEAVFKKELARVQGEEQLRAAALVKELEEYKKKVQEAEKRARYFLGADEAKAREALRLKFLSEQPAARSLFSDTTPPPSDALDELVHKATPPHLPLGSSAGVLAATARRAPDVMSLFSDTPAAPAPAQTAHVDPAARAHDLLKPDGPPASTGVAALFGDEWKQELTGKPGAATPSAATSSVLQRADQVLQDQAAHKARVQQQQLEQQRAALKAREDQLRKEREAAARQQQADEERARRQLDAHRKLREGEEERAQQEAELRFHQQQLAQTVQKAMADIVADARPLIHHATGLLEEVRCVLAQRAVPRCRMLESDGEQIATTVYKQLEALTPRLKSLEKTHQTDPGWCECVRQVHLARNAVVEAVRIARELRAMGLEQPSPSQPPAARTHPAAPAPQPAAAAPSAKLSWEAVRRERMEYQRRRAQLREQMLRAGRWALTPSPHAHATQHRRGLVNLGNTCYMNSLLQSLMGTQLILPFLDGSYLRDINRCNPLGSQGRVVNTFQKIVDDMHAPSGYPISPSLFKQAVGRENDMFSGQSQQDSNEFMQTLIACLHEDLNRARLTNNGKAKPVPEIVTQGKPDAAIAREAAQGFRINNDSVISEALSCLEKSRLRCPSCGYQSVSFTTHYSLSLPIPDDATLSDCLMKYTEEEQLAEGSEWKCPGCTHKVRAYKQLTLYSPPKLLVVTLNRFRTFGNLADKIRTPVVFPPTLDFRPYVAQNGGDYELVAIVNHDGGIGGGHYTADVKGRKDKQWFRFSDTRVTPSSGQPNFSQAYILFYQRL
eukprot:TRINITY_DN32193_c0_g1_i1.p1 TRINITY_DN32193_c0_g1~~TRINITY_DN32193_c0_g1_i1.p1  ORF type:complete len:897 (+),score=282.04 TRINITY_DN32193_c0_g1_i1:94-2784(+)